MAENTEKQTGIKRSKAKMKIEKNFGLNIFVSEEMNQQLVELSQKYDRSKSDIIRMALKAGIPVMKVLADTERELLSQYTDFLRKSRSMHLLKDKVDEL